MAKNSVSDWSTTAASNTDVASINIDEDCVPSGMNNAIRAIMAQIKTAFASVTFGATGFARIGTNRAPTFEADVYASGTTSTTVNVANDTVQGILQVSGTAQANVGTISNHPLVVVTNNTQRARFLDSGPLVIGSTTAVNASTAPFQITRSGGAPAVLQRTTTEGSMVFFDYGASTVGSISVTASATTYNTSSDYRLPWKAGMVDIEGSGAFIDALRPRYFPIAGASGFVAHEFAEVSPSSVTGEKDAVDEHGAPVYQAMQSSSPDVMANIVAELQSLRLRVAGLEQVN